MPTAIPFLRIEKELPSQLNLVSADRRWLIMFIAIVAALPLSFLGFLILMAGRDLLIWVPLFLVGLFTMMVLLLFVPTSSQLVISLGMRTLTLNRQYWLGFGVLERNREKSWSLSEITDAALVTRGQKKLIEVELNQKKGLVFDFGRKTEDAQRTYHLLQSWLKGLVPDSSAAITALKELEGEKQRQDTIKNAEKLLNYFGVFSLIGGAMGFYTDNSLTSTISIPTIISISTGLIYLGCGYGAKRRIEIALWIAILVVLAERLYWFIMSGSLSGEGNWSSWLTWVFAIFVVSSLWGAIRSIRAMDEEPAYQPLA